jgi:hypothetical protein
MYDFLYFGWKTEKDYIYYIYSNKTMINVRVFEREKKIASTCASYVHTSIENKTHTIMIVVGICERSYHGGDDYIFMMSLLEMANRIKFKKQNYLIIISADLNAKCINYSNAKSSVTDYYCLWPRTHTAHT